MNEIQKSAQLLGRIKSIKKTMACRLNGLKPCRPGKKRGRPRGLKNDKGDDE